MKYEKKKGFLETDIIHTIMRRKDLARRLNVVGNITIGISVLFLFFTFGPVLDKEISYQTKQVVKKVFKYSQENKIANIEKDLTPPNTDFSIVIPKIGAVAPVYANVDPFDENDFLLVLRKGVAHAKRTAFPGRVGNVYIFAHSTDAFYNIGRYNAIFYLIGKLETGDTIYMHYKNTKHTYEVYEKKVVSAGAVEYLGKLDKEKTLTLQTCYPPGTTLKRLVILAEEVETEGIDNSYN